MKRPEGTNGATVVIRVRNGESDLRELLPRLSAQALPPGVELGIVVVDNESDDDSAAVAAEHGAVVVPLPRDEFTWGRALNLGIDRANTDFIVLLSSDAWPLGSDWLAGMLAPFDDPRIGVAYGRQVPRDSAPLAEWLRVKKTFPDTVRRWTVDDIVDGAVSDLIASNACAVLRKSVWCEIRYDEASHGAEELPWTKAVLEAGYDATYVVNAAVEHSHRETAYRQAVRIWELELEKRRLKGTRIGPLAGAWIVGSFVKRRLQQLCSGLGGWRRRWEAARRLPIEAAVLAVVGARMVPASRRVHNRS